MGGLSHGGFAWSRLGLALGRLAAHLSQIRAVRDTPCGAAHRAVSSRDESAKRSRKTVVSEEAYRGSDWMSIMERCRGPLLEELTRHTPETTKRPNHVVFHSHDAFRATQGSRGLSNTNVVFFCLWVLYLAHRLQLLSIPTHLVADLWCLVKQSVRWHVSVCIAVQGSMTAKNDHMKSLGADSHKEYTHTHTDVVSHCCVATCQQFLRNNHQQNQRQDRG